MDSQKSLSVLVPSRERADVLKFSLDSLGLERNNIEALVWVDDDDPQLNEYRKLFGNNPQVKLFIKKRVGYENFHIMQNFLAAESSGNWLWLWNDDAYMDNVNWYDKFINLASLSNPKEEPIVYNLWSQGESESNLFPMVSRKYLEILGYFAGSANNDAWIKRVAQFSKIHRHILGIKPHHRKGGEEQHGDLTDNTSRYVNSIINKYHLDTIWSSNLASINGVIQDADKILDWIEINKDRSIRVGFINLGNKELPVALAIESRGKNVLAYNINPEVVPYFQNKTIPSGENRADEFLKYTKITSVDTIEELVKKTNLIFCAFKTTSENEIHDAIASDKEIYFNFPHFENTIKELVKTANKLNETTNLVMISPCSPGTYEKVIKPLLSPKINCFYNPISINTETPIQDFLNPEFVFIGVNNNSAIPLINFYKIILGEDKTCVTDIATAELMVQSASFNKEPENG